MAVKASAAITVSIERDIQGTWRFYRIASSASTPSAPTDAQGIAFVNNGTVPSGWSKVEPSYDGTSTNSLYIVDLTAFTDGSVVWTLVSKSSSYEAAKQAYNEAQNAKTMATDFIQTINNGVWVTPSTSKPDTNGNAISTTRGVRITDQIDVYRGVDSVAAFGETARMGKQDSIHLSIDDSKFGYFVDEVPVTTLNCSYELLEEDDDTADEGDVSLKNMELKVTSPVFSETDKEKASLTMHYEHGSGSAHPTYAQLLAQNLDEAYNKYAFVQVKSAAGSATVVLNSEGMTFTMVGDDGYAYLRGDLLASGMAGMVQMFAGWIPPRGWRFCDGSTLSRTAFSELFAVIGTTYGAGDGSTTFNLPDFRDNFPVGAGSTYALNSKGGANTVTLATTQIPAHTHGKSGAITNGITSSGAHTHTFKTQADYASSGSKKGIYSTTDGTWSGTTIMNSTGAHTHNLPAHEHTSVGGGQAHENRPPYIGINFIICTGKTS